jgi:hypothetical protein
MIILDTKANAATRYNAQSDAASREVLDFTPADSKDKSPSPHSGQSFVTTKKPLRKKVATVFASTTFRHFSRVTI